MTTTMSGSEEFATINETVAQLQSSLREYIEAAYHVSDPFLVAQRRALLDELGTIYQRAYLESTPRYSSVSKFRDIRGLDSNVSELLTSLAAPSDAFKPLLHDPPYKHQAESIEQVLTNQKSLIVMTGTGS